jgi:tetratricopeptide (TPR) repeat protein/DNA-binding SARP family transcriptional activator
MEIRLLGRVEVRHGGERLDMGEGQQLYTWIALVLGANQLVSQAQLVETVWPEGYDRPKSNLVPGYVSKIRNVLRSSGATDVVLDTVHSHYLLRISDDVLDTVRFTRLCEAAREEWNPETKIELLVDATGLWRGEFLQGVDIDRVGGPSVHTYADARLDAVGDLAELELVVGRHRAARDRCWPEVRADPTQHRMACLLMRALLAGGDPVRAVEVYHTTQDALERQHGIAPPEDLRRLMWLAKRGFSRARLPRPAPKFCGRAAELDVITRWARSGPADGDATVVWLHGMPGVGKTALAVAAAHDLRQDFPDGQVYVQLNGFTPNIERTGTSEALRTLLADLGVPSEHIPDNTDELIVLYQQKLADTRTLVVLDNAASDEHVQGLLPTTPGCLAIVTSRRLPGLVVAADLRLEPMPEKDAMELFRALAGRERIGGRADLVAEVVTACARLPMMITIVAKQFRNHRTWPLDYLVKLLGENGPWEVGDGAGAAACAVSYQHLNDEQQAMFRLCAHHPGQDFTPHAAAALFDISALRARTLLDGLYDVSLIEEIAPARYRLPDPLKQYAVHALSAAVHPVWPDALARLLDYYLVTTAAAIGDVFSFDQSGQPALNHQSPVAQRFPDPESAAKWLADERVSLVALIRHAASNNLPDHAWRLAVLLWRYFYTTGHLRDWSQTLELALDATSGDADRRGRAHVLLRLSGARWASGRHDQALELAATAYPLWADLGDVRGEADTLCAIALVHVDLGNHGLAMESFQAASEKYESIGDKRGQANALSNLGNLSELRGEFDRAEQRHLVAVALLEQIGHVQGLAHALDNLGCVRQRRGRLDDAMNDHSRARDLAVLIGDRCVQAYALNNIGNVCRQLGRLDDAVINHGAARELANEVGDPNLRTQLYLDRGATCVARREIQSARVAYHSALDLAAGTGDRRQQARGHHGIARTLHAEGQHREARAHWRLALTEYEILELPDAGELAAELKALDCPCAEHWESMPVDGGEPNRR